MAEVGKVINITNDVNQLLYLLNLIFAASKHTQ